jgi:hypothetical protein
LRRAACQVQSATIAVIALATLFATGIERGSATLAFNYPALAAALAGSGPAEDSGILATGAYFWKAIEEKRSDLAYMTWQHFAAEAPVLVRTGQRVAIFPYHLFSLLAAIVLGISIPSHSKITRAFQAGSSIPQGVSADDILLLNATLSVLVIILTLLVMLPAGSPKWREKSTAKIAKFEIGEPASAPR